MTTTTTTLERPRIATPAEWLAARKALLKKEKELTHLRDALAAERQALPWVRVEKNYVFDASGGKKSLADLFDGRSQLAVYHLMFGPDWAEACPSCSMIADSFDGAVVHIAQRDVSFAAISRAQLPKIEAFKARMDWRFPWVSSHDTSFNQDFRVSFTKEQLAAGNCYNFGTSGHPGEEAPGLSFFAKDESGTVFHTYSSFGRGVEDILPVYAFLDRAPRGRNEADLPFSMAWVRHHDRYKDGRLADADRPYWPAFEAEDPAPAKRSAAAKADSSCCHGENH
jgi:predicted dithiol-disulfide oxidoreductase (DUF899 family)